MKEAKKTQITEMICKQAQLMRKGGANQTEIGHLLGVNPCTISRIEAAGFDLETYTRNMRERRAKEKEKEKDTRTKVELVYDPSIAEEYRKEQEAKAEPQIEGQIEMELTTMKPEAGAAGQVDQTKMMRFQAAQVDKLIMKLDQIYNMTSMILRAVRKE